MSDLLSEHAVVRVLAHHVCQRLTRKLITTLQRMQDGLLSGNGSGLKNAWDEICVQIQYEQSFDWDAYDLTVRQLVQSEIEKLPPYEREAIWLQTPEADNWDCKYEEEREPYPLSNEDIVNYLVKEHIYHQAGRWENQRIRDYLDRASD